MRWLWMMVVAIGCAGCVTVDREAVLEAAPPRAEHGFRSAAAPERLGQRIFCVVPRQLPDGTSSEAARATFERWLVREAGGFTRFDGITGAWMNPQKEIIREENVGYLVSVYDGDAEALAAQIERRILRQFEQQAAYVERW